MNLFKSTKMVHQVISLAFVLEFAIFFILGGVFFYQAKKEQIQNINNLLRSELDSTVREINSHFKRIVHDENELGSYLLNLPESPGIREGLVNTFLTHNPLVIELSLVDSTGRELYRGSQINPVLKDEKRDITGLAPVRDALKGRSGVGEIIFNEYLYPELYRALPLPTGPGSHEYYALFRRINLSWLWEAIHDRHIGRTGVVYVFDSKDRLIAHSDSSLVLRGLKVEELLADVGRDCGMLVPGTVIYADNMKGEEVMRLCRRDSESGWLIVVELPVEEAFLPLKRIVRSTIFSFILSFLLSALVIVFFSKRIFNPLKKFKEGIMKVAAGERQVAMEIPYQLELRDLAETFNSMAKRLDTKISDLIDSKQETEAAREEIQSLLRRHQTILSSLAEGVCELDRGGRIRYINKPGLAILGYQHHKEVLGLPMQELVYAADDEAAQPLYSACFSGAVLVMESYFLKKSGERFAVVYATAPVGQGERHQGIVLSFRDVTQEKVLEDQLQQAQKMEAIGMMAGGVAHDLNNILSGVVSYPELLLLKIDEGHELRRPIEAIRDSGLRAAAMVNDLLTVARGVACVKKPLVVNRLICDYLSSIEFADLHSRHPLVKIEKHLDCKLCLCLCSSIHIQKIIQNLLGNGMEAIQGKGTVAICTSSRRLDAREAERLNLAAEEYVTIEVHDSGHGIDQKDLKRIFEPFFSKKVLGRSGTGIGLAVVWNTAQDHGGTVDVSSDSQGTVFTVYLPAVGAGAGDDEELNEEEDPHGSGSILVVDDEAIQRDIATEILLTLGYSVHAVASGEEAVAYLKENSVDLVMLDMVMDPGMSGRETFAEIKAINPAQRAIIVSGFSEDAEIHKATEMGVSHFLKKPYSIKALGRVIEEGLTA